MDAPVFTLSDYIFSFFLTVFVYDFIPIIISIIGKKHKLATIRIISIVNYILGYSFFYYIKSFYDSTPNGGVAFLWSSIGYCLMKERCLKPKNDDSHINDNPSTNIVSFPNQTSDGSRSLPHKKIFSIKWSNFLQYIKKFFPFVLRIFVCFYIVCSLFIICFQHNKTEQFAKYGENVSDSVKPTISFDTQSDICTISYDDLMSGAYDEQKVYIICRLENVSYSSKGSLSFDVYIANGDSYVYSDIWTLSPNYVKNHSTLANVQNGDFFQFGVCVYPGSSIDPNDIFFSKKLQNN